MAKIQKYFSVVVTYSEGNYDKVDAKLLANITLLKIPNRGMDIGAKFCMVHYLKEKGFSYEYILFLHSKSNPTTRAKYFTPLLNAIDDTFIENIKIMTDIFPTYNGRYKERKYQEFLVIHTWRIARYQREISFIEENY